MPLVCISGWKRSGKDTLAGYLIENYAAKQLSFAGPLKDEVAEDYDIPRNSLDDQDKKEQPLLNYPVQPKDAFSAMLADFMIKELRSASGNSAVGWDKTGEDWKGIIHGYEQSETMYHTPRSLAILRGSTNRFVETNWWVTKAMVSAQNTFDRNSDKILVVTDLRYKSEAAEVLKNHPNALIIRVERFETSPSTDPSERDMDDYDFKHRIDNRTSLDYAYDQLEVILRNNGGL